MFQAINVEELELDGIAIVTFGYPQLVDELIIDQIRSDFVSLVENNHRHIVVDFADVEFLSSAMIGALISLKKQSKCMKGRLLLAGLRPEIYEVFQVIKLNKIFEILEDRKEAIARLGLSVVFQAKCPVASCDNHFLVDWGGPDGSCTQVTTECAGCDCSLIIARRSRLHSHRAHLIEIDVPAYEGQSIRVQCPGSRKSEPIFTIHVTGELDLFVSESFEKAWKAIPKPRMTLVDLTKCTEITEQAIENLRELKEAPDSYVVVLTTWGRNVGEELLGFPSYFDRSEAVENLLERSSEVDCVTQVDLKIETVAAG